MRSARLATACCLAALVVGPASLADDKWKLTPDPNSYDDSMLLSQASADSILDEYGTKDVHPVLSFSCADGGIAMQIDWLRFISSFKTEAGFKIDDGDATWLKLDVDSSNKITSAGAAGASPLIDAMSGGSTLQVEIAPYSEPSVFVRFDITSFEAALAELRDTC